MNKVCGDSFYYDRLCCSETQLNTLGSSLSIAYNVLSTCPACYNNFREFFCEFTCSPQQSVFLNVTKIEKSPKTQKDLVTELDFYLDHEYGKRFFDGCKDVKFTADNGYVMDLIGGGAKNWQEMVKFLGHKSGAGSPFQINFPLVSPPKKSKLVPLNKETHMCNNTDPQSRCSCVDCDQVCPVLEPIDKGYSKPFWEYDCYIGKCFGLELMIAFIILFLTISVWSTKQPLIIKWREWSSSFYSHSSFEPVPVENEEDETPNSFTYPATPTPNYLATSYLHEMFYQLGKFCSTKKLLTILLTLVVLTIGSLGWLHLRIDTEPVKLWVGPNSKALQNKNFFDSNFGAFYRSQQIIFTSTTNSNIFTKELVRDIFEIQGEISELVSSRYQVKLEHVCFRPVDQGCLIQSISGYWQDDLDRFDEDEEWEDTLDSCLNHPANCLPPAGAPIKPEIVLGGPLQKPGDAPNFKDSTSFIVTYVLPNPAGHIDKAKIEDWELSLIEYLKLKQTKFNSNNNYKFSFSTESSLEIELNQSSNRDIGIIMWSYLAMFIYAAFSLNQQRVTLSSIKDGTFFVKSKVGLGLIGILLVIISVIFSIGVFSWFGGSITLIIVEVIPFLVLAIGVDNLFLIIKEFEIQSNYAKNQSLDSNASMFTAPSGSIEVINQSDDSVTVNQPISETVARALGSIGPSLFMSAVCQGAAFGIAGLVDMPAVSSFAKVACLSVLANMFLQVTIFVAFLTLDAQRVKEGRIDILFFLKLNRSSDDSETNQTWLEYFTVNYYTPFLFHPLTKGLVLLLFGSYFLFSLSLLPSTPLGLDQRIALPTTSYLVNYFNDLDSQLRIGPPVYFIVKGADPTHLEGQKEFCGRFGGCEQFSVANILEQERKRANVSYVAQPAAVWIDDFMHFLNPALEGCCRIRKENLPELVPCDPFDDEDACMSCLEGRHPSWNVSLAGIPQGKEFVKFLEFWMESIPGEQCPLAGKGGYSEAISLAKYDPTIEASHFRTYHTPLKEQKDYIGALKQATRISEEIQSHLIQNGAPSNTEVFPYSVFYIFFEQYTYIIELTAKLILACISLVSFVHLILTGSFRTTFILALVLAMVVVDVQATSMVLLGQILNSPDSDRVQLNAISLVNLIICIGLTVEFCSHFLHAYHTLPIPPPIPPLDSNVKIPDVRRANAATTKVLPTVVVGITLTKFIGLSVLAFTKSKLFEIYYFRMYLTIILTAALHSLILLPILLSLLPNTPSHLAQIGSVGNIDRISAYFHPSNWWLFILGLKDLFQGNSERFGAGQSSATSVPGSNSGSGERQPLLSRLGRNEEEDSEVDG